MRVVRYWTERGIDGWRLDVPNEIDDDSFWEEFSDLVSGINPQAYTVGEIWDLQARWVGDHHFNGVMNYPLRAALIEFLNQKSTSIEFSSKVSHFLQAYPNENLNALYLLLGSHDTERIMALLGGNSNKIKLAFLLLFTYPGVPSIYYGDEIGLEGGKDPDCRRAFPWDESRWNGELRNWVQKLIRIRKQEIALRTGICRVLHGTHPDTVFSTVRILNNDALITVINANSKPWDGILPVGEAGWRSGDLLEDLLGGKRIRLEGDHLQLQIPAHGGFLLKRIEMGGDHG